MKQTFVLREQGEGNATLSATVDDENGQIGIVVDGYGNRAAPGCPVAGLELYEGRLRVLYWPDYGSEECTAVDLSGAADETFRAVLEAQAVADAVEKLAGWNVRGIAEAIAQMMLEDADGCRKADQFIGDGEMFDAYACDELQSVQSREGQHYDLVSEAIKTLAIALYSHNT